MNSYMQETASIQGLRLGVISSYMSTDVLVLRLRLKS